MKFWYGIVTPHVRESHEFYTDLFGCSLVYQGEDDWFVLLELDGVELAFMKPGLDFMSSRFRQPHSGFGTWLTVEVDDVDSEYQRLEAAGANIVEAIRDEPWGDRHFVLVDPSGLPVDVVTHMSPAADD